ncbi:MAG: hypothetical protein ACLUTA_14530 [Blautia wexlerae]
MKAAVVVANEDVRYQEVERTSGKTGLGKSKSKMFRYLRIRCSTCTA